MVSLALATVFSWLGLIHERLDILSHFRLHLSVASIIIVPTLSIILSWRWTSIAILLASFNYWTSIGFPHSNTALAEPIFSDPTPTQLLKIISLNTLYLAKNDKQIIAFIEHEQPDIILMQEVPPWKKDVLEHLKQLYPWQEHCATPTQCEVALLSRHPWQYSKSGIYGKEGGAMALARFGPEFHNLTVASIHLRWPFKSPQYSNLSTAYKQLGIHDEPLLIGGDFNSTAWSTVLKKFSLSTHLKPVGKFQATWPVRSPRTGRSYTWLFPQFQLDHIFVSTDIKVLNFQRGDDIGSDHLPLISEISFPLTQEVIKPEAGHQDKSIPASPFPD